MAGPPPAVAEVRHAVRQALVDLPDDALVLVACSGGADSLALAAATAFEARAARWRAGLVTVDHGLQEGSAALAGRVAAWGATAGLAPAEVAQVSVGGAGGPEAAARTARYAALDAAADRHGAEAVLLGHTREDQAETVLLGLARGSGARSLSGMAPRRGRYRRPLLDVSRSTTRDACVAEQLAVWDDPHNTDPSFARVRVRSLLTELERAAPGAVAGLARSARLLRADADALDALAAAAEPGARTADGGLDCEALAELPAAVRARVLLTAALVAGAVAGTLGSVHVEALDALVVGWHGQGPVALPGGVRAVRRSGTLNFDAPGVEPTG